MFRVVLPLLLAASVVAAPVPKEMKPKAEGLAGTTWRGDGICGPTVYTFEKDGRLTYSYGTSCWRNGTWKLEGDKLYWEVNQKYAEFDGTVKDGVITGKSWNVAGGSWTLVYKKDPDATHPKAPDETIFPPGGKK
jgi:hypothetical protein